MNPYVDGTPSDGSGGLLLALALTVGGSVLLALFAWVAVKWDRCQERIVWRRMEREIATFVRKRGA